MLLSMARGIRAFAAAALLLALIAALLLRSCRKGPAVSEDFPPAEPASTPMPGPPLPSRAYVAKRRPAHRHGGLVAPRLLNLDELQADIRKYYPEAERRAGKESHVTLTLDIGADGAVGGIRVAASGGADFDAAAQKAAQAMRFAPATKAGAPVAVEINEGIDFQTDAR